MYISPYRQHIVMTLISKATPTDIDFILGLSEMSRFVRSSVGPAPFLESGGLWA